MTIKSINNFMLEAIKYKNVTEQVDIISAVNISSDQCFYSVQNKNGILFRQVPGYPGLTGKAVMGYLNGDRSRPVIVGPAG